MLDLYLRGWGPISPGADMILVVAGEAQEISDVDAPGEPVLDGHGFQVRFSDTESVRKWSHGLCRADIKLGGAWDALSVLAPNMTTNDSTGWWECP